MHGNAKECTFKSLIQGQILNPKTATATQTERLCDVLCFNYIPYNDHCVCVPLVTSVALSLIYFLPFSVIELSDMRFFVLVD